MEYTVGVVVNCTVFGVPTGSPACNNCSTKDVDALDHAWKVVVNPETPDVKGTANAKPVTVNTSVMLAVV
jgi:hypothetical protein